MIRVPQPSRGAPHVAVSERARDFPQASQLTLDLATARDLEELQISGQTLWAVDGDVNGTVTLRLNDRSAAPITFSPGLSVSGQPFGVVYATNAAQADKSITLLHTRAVLGIENPARFNVNVNVSQGRRVSAQGSITKGAGLTEEILPANPDRISALLSVAFFVGGTGDDNRWQFKFGSAPAAGDESGWIIAHGKDSLAGPAVDRVWLYGTESIWVRNAHPTFAHQLEFVEFSS